MKKLIFTFLLFISLIPTAFADNIQLSIADRPTDVYYSSVVDTIYNSIIPSQSELYHVVYYQYNPNFDESWFEIYFFDSFNSIVEEIVTGDIFRVQLIADFTHYCGIDNISNNTSYTCRSNESIATNILDYASNNSSYYYHLYDSNYPLVVDSPFEMSAYYSDSIILDTGDRFPLLKDLSTYSTWSDYENNHLVGYTTVNLDNYDYVILSLKNYNQSQPFQTDLQVLGQVGFTPVYNYGQSSKDSVTGSQVQDRCNVFYSSYTTYPLYILQSDLNNHSVFYVKECTSNSSFKFDSTVFDLTYISPGDTSPSITIGNNTYDVIPYDSLPSSATENETNNYIPGQSGSATDTGGLDSAIKTAQDSLSNIWDTLTYFTSLVGLLFSSLPTELRGILLSAFIVTLTIGIIKIFVR